MVCVVARTWLFRRLDGELSPAQHEELEAHLRVCPSCMRESRLLILPRRIGQVLPIFEPSPYFYSRLKARIESESQTITVWQIILAVSRHALPAFAAITLALLSTFAYLQLREPRVDVYQAYDRIFTSGDPSQQAVIAVQGEITDESLLRAIAEEPRAGSDTTSDK